MSRALMIQGTGSNVGKSLLVAGLCRAAVRRGISVAPFKPQNMSNNAAVTADNGEIGRAQAMQALACGLPPHTDMNPVLLKPETDIGAQVIVQGKRLTTVRAAEYANLKKSLQAPVLESFSRLRAAYDLIIVEGAGSPAEVNLRAGDIANMGFSEATGVPVILAGDIDRGGVIAQMVGTKAVMDAADSNRVKGFVINKFRGDPRLFDGGYELIEARTGWRGYGVLPWFPEAWRLPAEDALDLRRERGRGPFHIVCLTLSRIANFDDLDPLSQEPSVTLTMLGPGQPVPGDAALVIIPGSKSTRGDLAYLRAQGWDIDLVAHRRRGGHILGICAGFQMLGFSISDPDGIEGPPGSDPGLRLLGVETALMPVKRLTEVRALHVQTGTPFDGYEIHVGKTDGPARARPFARIEGVAEGAVSGDGLVAGTYLHGMFRDDEFRERYLATYGSASTIHYSEVIDQTLDKLADHIEAHLDVDGLLSVAR